MPKIVRDEKIYQAAIQVVIDRGYTGATTNQIAQTAEISEVTLFRKYGSKAVLIKQAIAAIAKQIDIGTSVRYSSDVVADLLRVVHLYQESAAIHGQFFYTLLLEIPRNPELSDLIDLPMTMISQVGQLLVRYQEEGILRQEHPLHAVAGLLGPLMVLNMMRGVKPAGPLPDIDLTAHVHQFLDGRRLVDA